MDNTQIIFIMLACGTFGGIVNFFLLDQPSENFNVGYMLVKSVLLGIAASFLVPLFLNTIASDILKGDKDKVFPAINYFIFSGFCLLAAILSKRFIEDLYSKILKLEKETKAGIKEAKEEAKTAKAEAKEAKSTIQEISTEPDDLTKTKSLLEQYLPQPEVKTNAFKIISAIQDSPYAYRTQKGLRKDADLSEEKLKQTLGQLIDKNIIATRVGNSGTEVYKVNDPVSWSDPVAKLNDPNQPH